VRRVGSCSGQDVRFHAEVLAFVDEIPGASQLQHHFYERIASEDWLPALQKRGLLGELRSWRRAATERCRAARTIPATRRNPRQREPRSLRTALRASVERRPCRFVP